MMSRRKMETITVTTPVIIEDKDTYLEKYKEIKKVSTITVNKMGLTPKIIPPDVATAFPPLNLAKIGYVCPRTAKIPIMSRDTSTSKNNEIGRASCRERKKK